MRIAALLLLAIAAGCAIDAPAPSSSPGTPSAAGSTAPAAPVGLPPDAALSGSWVPVLAELGGREFKFGQDFRLEVKGDRYELYGSPQGVDRGSLVFLAGDPRALDVIGEQGPSQGKRFPAIYRLMADGRLEVCYDLEQKYRPAAFVTLDGTQLFRIIYKRR